MKNVKVTPVGRTRPWTGYLPGDCVIRTDGSDHAPGPGEYQPVQWVDPVTGDVFPNTYHIGDILLVLFDQAHFFLVVEKTCKHFGLVAMHTTSIEQVIAGVHMLDDACHWDEFESCDDETKIYLYQLTELVYKNYFGAELEISLFGKAFHRAIAQAIRNVKAIEQSAL